MTREAGTGDSPAERYARFRAQQAAPVLADFTALYDFGFDGFQTRACEALEAGEGVLVAAPTGSGKTIVGEFAAHLALAQGRKCFYTTPIKALSNQKYADLVRRYGPDRVGLLTGDNSVNGEAPVVVMTTEVLRNMLYAGSTTLADLGYVVMDEVHYLADRSRGAVWEEVIIHLPESVVVVSLSATVSNAEEFGEWLATVRGTTTVIVEEKRPVPLYQHVMVGRRLYDLFEECSGFPGPDSVVNPDLVVATRERPGSARIADRRGRRPSSDRDSRGRRPPPRGGLPPRFDVVERLERDALLPAIYFVFSRVGCDAAVEQCLAANLRLTTPAERARIREYVEERCARIPEADLHVLGYHDYREGLARGIAAHHAGMLPTFKECVEELFAAGLCKVVFATDTLALGVNMPARSVVIEKLVKWNGETHAEITPGEYTQLTGRAGRRGIDVEGHGVVLWTPGMDPKAVAGLASKRTYPLRSSFRPSYTMAVNLVDRFGRSTARELLESSFAQFQADRAVVGLARQLRRNEGALEGYAEAARCDRGDALDYVGLRRRLSDTESAAARSRRDDRRQQVVDAVEALRPGDVIEVPTGRYAGYAVVVDPGGRGDRHGPRPQVVTVDRQARRLSLTDFDRPVTALTRMKVPRSFNPRNPQARRTLALQLAERVGQLPPAPRERVRRGRAPTDSATEAEIARLRAEIRRHPVHACEDRDAHVRWAERHEKLTRETVALRRRIDTRTNTIARQFDRVCEVLTSLGYLDDDKVTPAGRILMRIYTEMDLVAAECLRTRVWDDLGPADLAAALSVLVYEGRRSDDSTPPRPPRGEVRGTIGAMVGVWAELDDLERTHRLDFLREPDLGFAWAAQAWASGARLDEVLGVTDLAAGDFVRWMKQLLDLTGQVAEAADSPGLRASARACVDALRRGVVAYSSLVD